jgi:hypothetical protein
VIPAAKTNTQIPKYDFMASPSSMNLRQNSHLTGTQPLNTSNCHHFEISDLPSIRGSALAVAAD